MRHNIIETLVGAIVLTTAAIFIRFAYTNSQLRPTKDAATFMAHFNSIDGLAPGSDVRLSGVKIGTVGDISIDPQTYMAVVKIHCDPAIHLPTDTAAAVVSNGLMGSKYISVSPGADEMSLKDGDQIMHTQSSMNLEALIGQAIFSSKSA